MFERQFEGLNEWIWVLDWRSCRVIEEGELVCVFVEVEVVGLLDALGWNG